jgi:hypothetical protein
MKISVKETGGFAGLSQDVAAVDTAVLGAAAQPIEQAVHAAGFFDLPSRVGEWIGSDPMMFEVTVSDGDREHTVSFIKYDQSPATAPLHKLVEAARQRT